MAALTKPSTVTPDALQAQARALGFDLCGVAPAAALPELARLPDWLARGRAGEMAYLHQSAEVRADIRQFLPGTRAVIVTASTYYTGSPPAAASPAIARYAWGEDYHVVLAERLTRLAAWLREQVATPFEWRLFVDKHPVQERVYARYAGLGWIGKNTCLINPDAGSWLFLAGLAVTLDLAPGTPTPDLCGQCTLCLDACPTGALVDAYELDATRCISYLTIEKRGDVPEPARAQVGNHVYGCDICQEVCPYNLAPLATLDPAWQPRAGRADADPAALWAQSDFSLHQMIEGSAMERVTVSQLRRNIAMTLGNGGDPSSAELLDRPAGGVPRAAQAADTPMVKAHVAWAKARLER